MIKRILPIFSKLSWAWFIVILLFAVFDTRSIFIEKKVQFDLMSLLPKSKTETLKALNQLMDEANIAGHVLILIGHQNASLAQSALVELQKDISTISLPLKEQTSASFIEEYKHLFKELYPYRAGFLSEGDRKLLRGGNEKAFTKKALSAIMSPLSHFGSVNLKSDPFFLYSHFMSSLQPSTQMQLNNKEQTFIQAEGKTWYLFKAVLTEPAFSMKTQEEISEKLIPILEKLQKKDGVEILKTGAVFYAATASSQANKEVSFMGFASMGAIILILLLTFNSVRPLVFAIGVISSGLIVGLGTCLLIYGTVHILALVFGSSLVGVTVDYSLHYYCASYKNDEAISLNRLGILRTLMPALFLGVLSSVIGYSFLMIPPFPGVQQLAILASVGLLSSFITVCLWGPYFVKINAGKVPHVAEKIQYFLNITANFGGFKGLRLFLSMGLISIFFLGIAALTFEDDVRSFQSLDRPLKGEEDRISSMIKLDTAPKFLIITKPTIEEVLHVTEEISDALQSLQNTGKISSYRGLATLIPSQQRQQENRRLVEALHTKEGPHLTHVLGLTDHFEEVGDGPVFALNHTHLNLLPDVWRDLITLQSDGTVVGRLHLYGVKDSESLNELSSKYEDVVYIDPPGEYSLLFASYRAIMLWILLSVIGGIALFLFLWKGLKQAVLILSPVCLSVLATIGIIGLNGGAFNLFHAMGLLLVLSIGIDYAFFLYWRKASENGEKERNLLLTANGLAAITTILSFGLLAFSKTCAINSFGLTVFIGICLNFCVTTLFLGKVKLDHDA